MITEEQIDTAGIGEQFNFNSGRGSLVRFGNLLFAIVIKFDTLAVPLLTGPIKIYRRNAAGVWDDIGTGPNAVGCAAARLDSDTIGIVYSDVVNEECRYITFDWFTTSFGSFETIEAYPSSPGNLVPQVSIAADSNGIPHVCYHHTFVDFFTFSTILRTRYANRIGGSWNTPIVISNSSSNDLDVLVDYNNIPKAAAISGGRLFVYKGNANNATSFTAAFSGGAGNRPLSVACDLNNNMYVHYAIGTSIPRVIIVDDFPFQVTSGINLFGVGASNCQIFRGKRLTIATISTTAPSTLRIATRYDPGSASTSDWRIFNTGVTVRAHRIRWSTYFDDHLERWLIDGVYDLNLNLRYFRKEIKHDFI